MKGSRIVKLAIAGITVFGGVQMAVADVQYSFTTIDFPGAPFTVGSGINDSGQIVGQYMVDGIHGFLDSGGSFTTIDFPGAPFIVSSGINDSGQIVGQYIVVDGIHGFLDSGGSFTTASWLRPTGVPEPRTLPVLAGCFIGLAMALGRKSVRYGASRMRKNSQNKLP